MANRQVVSYVNGFVSKRESKEIVDKDTGERTPFWVYTFAFDCYIQELDAVYTHDKLPQNAEIYDAWIPATDKAQLEILNVCKLQQRMQFTTIPGGKGGNKRGASGLKMKFLKAVAL